MGKASGKQKSSNKSIYLKIWQGKRRARFGLALRLGRHIPGKDFCFVADEALVSYVLLPVGKFYSQSTESPQQDGLATPACACAEYHALWHFSQVNSSDRRHDAL